MLSAQVSSWLQDDFNMLKNYLEGKIVKRVLSLTENDISILLEDGIIIDFVYLEDEITFDIKIPNV